MKIKKWLIRGMLGILALLLLLTAVLALSNRMLPTESAQAAALSAAEKARLAETIQVRQQVGDVVWPGWETAVIPLVIYNEAYAFLLGYPNPPDGWINVSTNEPHGGPWEQVPDDLFNGEPYYRQPLPASGETPQAFTVRVGERWAASMQTQEWLEISLSNQLRADLPAFLAPIFPYQIANNLFLRGSDGYISLLSHESFHAYQGAVAPERLTAAETAVSQSESRYPWEDAAFQDAWQAELDLLATAVQSETDAEAVILAQQFLTQRMLRRQAASLDSNLIDYEQQREWLEGLARYVELETWRQASLADDYQPVAGLQDDPDFDGYATFDKRWTQEVDQIGRMADDHGDGRFYYSGMAQAVLLDRLLPGWKTQALPDGLFLEELLATAVSAASSNQPAPFLLVEVVPDRLWTPIYGRATVNAQIYFAYDGDASRPLDEPVHLQVSPAIKADGEFTLVDNSWGLISKPAYTDHLAQALAEEIAAALQDDVFRMP